MVSSSFLKVPILYRAYCIGRGLPNLQSSEQQIEVFIARVHHLLTLMSFQTSVNIVILN